MINTFVFPIVRHNFIFEAIRSLHKNTPKNFATIVVDQAIPDGKELQLRAWSDLYIQANKNYGFAQAANIGLRLATTGFVTVCNDDVVFFDDGWWEGIIRTFNEFPTSAAVNPSSPKEPGWGYNESGYRIHATLEECQNNSRDVADRLTSDKAGAMVDGIAMWCTVFQRDAMEEVGWFDERFFPGGSEDYDLLARIYQAGHRALGTSYSWVWHHWGQSKDDPHGLDQAMPKAKEDWNKTSTDGFGDEGLWHPKLDVWGKGCERTDPSIWRAPL